MNIAFLLFMPIDLSQPVFNTDIADKFEQQVYSSPMEIASDSSFASKTSKFTSGQTVYVRVTTANDGSDKKVLNLRDNSYNLITTYSFNKNDDQFTVNFPAPSTSGTYSLEANIVSSGSVANFVQTIQVGEGQSQNSSVKVNIDNKVNTSQGDQTVLGQKAEESPTPSTPPPAEAQTQKHNFFYNFWQTMTAFFRNIFSKPKLTG